MKLIFLLLMCSVAYGQKDSITIYASPITLGPGSLSAFSSYKQSYCSMVLDRKDSAITIAGDTLDCIRGLFRSRTKAYEEIELLSTIVYRYEQLGRARNAVLRDFSEKNKKALDRARIALNQAVSKLNKYRDDDTD